VTVFFEGLGLAIVTGSKSGIVILRSVASRNTFLRCRDVKTGTEIYSSELYQISVQQKKQSSTFYRFLLWKAVIGLFSCFWVS
jgi:hypothetical protein